MRTAALGTAALGTACTPEAEEVSINRIVIDAPVEMDREADARQAVREGVRVRLEADDSVDARAGHPEATHNVRLEVYPVAERDGESIRPVEVELHSLGGAPSFTAIARGAPGAPTAGVILAAFEDAWGAIRHMRDLDVQKDSALVAALADPDVRVRTFVIERLGSRRSRDAVEPLIARLRDEENPELALRAVGALVAIGEETAVPALIDLTQQKDPEFVLQIVFAVAAIGGRTAEGFLVTLASGHPHPEIQQGAKDALDELHRRREGG